MNAKTNGFVRWATAIAGLIGLGLLLLGFLWNMSRQWSVVNLNRTNVEANSEAMRAATQSIAANTLDIVRIQRDLDHFQQAQKEINAEQRTLRREIVEKLDAILLRLPP